MSVIHATTFRSLDAESAHHLTLDIARHPEHLKSLDAGLLRHVKALTQAVQVDLDAPLSADDE